MLSSCFVTTYPIICAKIVTTTRVACSIDHCFLLLWHCIVSFKCQRFFRYRRSSKNATMMCKRMTHQWLERSPNADWMVFSSSSSIWAPPTVTHHQLSLSKETAFQCFSTGVGSQRPPFNAPFFRRFFSCSRLCHRRGAGVDSQLVDYNGGHGTFFFVKSAFFHTIGYEEGEPRCE